MKLYVGVTDNDWYRFLSQLPNVDEVNFWQPEGSTAQGKSKKVKLNGRGNRGSA